MTLETERLILRPFEARDRAPFAALNSDPEVMRHFPAPLNRAESDALFDAVARKRAVEGLCFAAIEEKDVGFAGMCGLSRPGFSAHFTPCVEIGWRLVRPSWGRGIASEAARAWLDHGFGVLELEEIVAFTTRANVRSMAVMERIGMRRDAADDFLHPSLDPAHPIAPHVLYRLRRGAQAGAAGKA